MSDQENNSINKNLPIEYPTQSDSDPKILVNAKLYWIAGFILVATIGVVLLWSLGDFFVGEIVRDFDIDQVENFTQADEEAPYFDLENSSGVKINSGDYLNKPLVLVFWASWNQASIDQLRIISQDITSDNKEVFSILAINSQEDKSIVNNFIKRGDYGTEVLLDPSGEITVLYGAKVLPSIYFIDPGGLIRERYVGVLDAKTIVDKVEKILQIE